MKWNFLYQITDASRTTDLGATAPQIPVLSSVLNGICWTPPKKIPGYATDYMYRQFNIQQLYVLPTQCIYVFCVDLRTNSHYFPIQH